MIYTLPYQSEALLIPKFYEIRNVMNTVSDRIHLTVKQSIFEDLSVEDIYKTILKIEGQYRSKNNSWSDTPAHVEIVKQL